jgi:hypothetical protein
LDEAAKHEPTLREALAFFVEREIARKDERRIKKAVKIAPDGAGSRRLRLRCPALARPGGHP